MTDERMPQPAPPATGETPAARSGPAIEAASVDVERPPSESALPGAHRGGFRRELTQPLPIAPPLAVHPAPESAPVPLEARWIHPPPALPRSAGWSLLFGSLGLVLACFVGWGFPIGVIGAVLAIAALRRPWERRETAFWGLGLSVASLVYSAGWLWWASTQGPLFG